MRSRFNRLSRLWQPTNRAQNHVLHILGLSPDAKAVAQGFDRMHRRNTNRAVKRDIRTEIRFGRDGTTCYSTSVGHQVQPNGSCTPIICNSGKPFAGAARTDIVVGQGGNQPGQRRFEDIQKPLGCERNVAVHSIFEKPHLWWWRSGRSRRLRRAIALMECPTNRFPQGQNPGEATPTCGWPFGGQGF